MSTLKWKKEPFWVYTPLYENDIKEDQNRPMETTKQSVWSGQYPKNIFEIWKYRCQGTIDADSIFGSQILPCLVLIYICKMTSASRSNYKFNFSSFSQNKILFFIIFIPFEGTAYIWLTAHNRKWEFHKKFHIFVFGWRPDINVYYWSILTNRWTCKRRSHSQAV